jgi:hypothetical protein
LTSGGVAEAAPNQTHLTARHQGEIIAKLKELKALIEKGDPKPWEFRGMKAIWFSRHLYQPLLYMDRPSMAAQYILFQEEDKDTYVRSTLETVGPAGTPTMAGAFHRKRFASAGDA